MDRVNKFQDRAMRDAFDRARVRLIGAVVVLIVSAFCPPWEDALGGEVFSVPSGCPEQAISAAGSGGDSTLRSPLRIEPFGGQVIDKTKQLHVFTSAAEKNVLVKNGAKFQRYFFVVANEHNKSVTCQYVGSFWGLATDTPFSGGILYNGLPLIYDAVDPDGGYQHYVFLDGRYRAASRLSAGALLDVLTAITDNPTTYKYSLDWSQDDSRYSYEAE